MLDCCDRAARRSFRSRSPTAGSFAWQKPAPARRRRLPRRPERSREALKPHPDNRSGPAHRRQSGGGGSNKAAVQTCWSNWRGSGIPEYLLACSRCSSQKIPRASSIDKCQSDKALRTIVYFNAPDSYAWVNWTKPDWRLRDANLWAFR